MIMPSQFSGSRLLLTHLICGIALIAGSSFGDERSNEVENATGQQPEEVGQSGESSDERSQQNDAIQDASALWNEFIDQYTDSGEWSIDDEEMDLLHHIVVTRVRDEGILALQDISESLIDDDVRFGVLGRLLEELVQSDPRLAFDAAIGLQHQDMERTLVWDVTINWATSDPKSVLNHLATTDLDIDLLGQLRETVIRKWASRSPNTLLGEIDQLPEELHVFSQQLALQSIADRAPKSAASQLSSIQAVEDRLVVAKSIARSWLRQDVAEAINWVQISPDLEELRREVLVEVLQDLAETNPTLAFDTALQHPIHGSEVGLEASVIARLAHNDVDATKELLQMVRLGATQVAASTSVGVALARSGDFDQALALGRQLPESSQPIYSATVVASWSISNPNSVVEEIDQLPTDDLKAQAAFMALSGDKQHKKLTKDQVQKLKTYMSEEMLQAIEQVEQMMLIFE